MAQTLTQLSSALPSHYEVSPDGRRFVLLRDIDRYRTDELRVVLHAFDAAKE